MPKVATAPLAAVPEHTETTLGSEGEEDWRQVRQQVAELVQEVRAVAHGLRTTEAALDVHKSLLSQEFGVFRRELRAEVAAVKDIVARNATEVQDFSRTLHREALERESAISVLRKDIRRMVKVEVARVTCFENGKARSTANAFEIGPHQRLCIPDTQQFSARIRALAVDGRPTPRTGSEPPTSRSVASSRLSWTPDTARDLVSKESLQEAARQLSPALPEDGRRRSTAADRKVKVFTFDEASLGSQASTEFASEGGATSADSAQTTPAAPATPAFAMEAETGDGRDAKATDKMNAIECGPLADTDQKNVEARVCSVLPMDSPESFSARGVLDCSAPLSAKLVAAVAAVRAQSPKVFECDSDNGQAFSFRASRKGACTNSGQAQTDALVERLVEKIEDELRDDFQHPSVHVRGLSPLLETWGAPAPPESCDDLSFEQRLDRLLAEVAVVPRITPKTTPRVTPRATPESSPSGLAKANRVSSLSQGHGASPEPHPEPIRGSSPGPDNRMAQSHARGA